MSVSGGAWLGTTVSTEPQPPTPPNPHPIWTDTSPSMIACACLSLYVHVLMCAKSVKKKECKKKWQLPKWNCRIIVIFDSCVVNK